MQHVGSAPGSELDPEFLRRRVSELEAERSAQDATTADLRARAALLGAMQQAIIATDLDGRVTYWNPYAERLYGWSAEEAQGRPIWELALPEVPSEEPEQILERLRRGERRSGEFTARRKDGSTFPAHVTDSPLYSDGGELAGVLGICEDISERKQAEAEQAQALRLSEALDHVSALLVSTLDPVEVMQRAMTASAEAMAADMANIGLRDGDEWVLSYTHGLSPAAIGRRFTLPEGSPTARMVQERRPMAIEDCRAGDYASREEMEQAGVRAVLQVPLTRQDEVFGVLSFGYHQPQQFGSAQWRFARKLAAFLALALENARLYEAERRQRQMLESLIEAVPIGIAVVRGPEHRYELANPAYRAIAGDPEAQMVGSTLAEVFPEVAAEVALSMLAQVYESGGTVSVSDYETAAVPGRDVSFWDVDDVPLVGDQGRVDGVLILTRDATEQVLARRRVEALAAELRAILEQLPDGVMVVDASSRRVTLANRQLERILRCSFGPDSVAGYPHSYRGYRPDGREYGPDEYPLVRALLTGEEVAGEEILFRLHDGGETWAAVSAAPIRDGEGRITAAAAVLTDIDARKAAEAQVESIARFPEENPHPILRFTTEGQLLYANRPGHSLLRAWAEETALPAVTELLREATEAGEGRDHLIRLGERAFALNFVPISGAGYVNVYGRDITPRVRAEEALRDSRAELERQTRFLDATLSSIPDYVYAFDREKRFCYANRAMLGLFGLEWPEMIGKSLSDLDYPPDLERRLNRHIEHVLSAGETIEDEVSYTSPIGISGEFEFAWGPVCDQNGSVSMVVGVSRDTTERRRAEKERERLLAEVSAARAEAEERAAQLEAVLSAMAEALIVHDRQGRIVRMNEAAEGIFGFSEAEKALPLIERQKLRNSARADGSPYGLGETPGARVLRGERVEGEVAGVLDDRGEWVWLSVSGASILGADGAIAGTVMTFTDVTRLRQAEAHMRRSYELSQTLDEIHGLLGSSLDPDAVMEGAAAAASRALEADFCAVALREGDHWVQTYSYGPCPAAAGARYRLEDAKLTLRAVTERRPILIQDCRSDDCPSRELMEAHGVRAVAVLPMFSRGEATGVISLNYRKPRRFTPAELEFAGKLTTAMALTLENARLYAEEKQRARELEVVIEAVALPIGIYDGRGRLVRMNRTAGELRHSTADEQALPLKERYGLWRVQTWDGEPLPVEQHPLQRALSEGVSVTTPVRTAREGEPWRYVVRTAAPMRDESGSITGAVSSAVDVTELHQAQEALERTNATLYRERALLAAVLEQMPSGVIVAEAPSGKVLLRNDQVDRIWLRPLPARDSITDYSACPGYDVDGTRLRAEEWPLARAITSGETVVDEETEFERGDGTRGTMRASAGPIRDEGDSIVAGVVIFSDVTKERQAERALAQERERLAITLRSMGEGVITTDAAGRVTTLNRAAEAMTGWSEQEALGRPLAEVFALRYVNGAGSWDLIETGVVGRAGVPRRATVACRDGTERLATVVPAPMTDAEGRVGGTVIVFQDVTLQQRLEEETLKANKLESLGVLAGGIAHDFNNLLTAILGNLILARLETEGQQELEELLSEAERASTRAKGLTQQLLTFAKGGEPLTRVLALPQVITDAASFSLRGTLSLPRYDFAPDLWPVEADAGQLAQVVQNLAINANEAMARGGSVRISARNVVLTAEDPLPVTPGRYVRVTVADEGGGIPGEIRGRIFDPYYTTKPKGSGLGLSVVYSIMVKHGGYVTVESEVGRGSRFHLYRPAARGEVMAVEPAAPARGCDRRVLVMDDEDIVLRVARRMLERLGCEVELAREGGQATELYARALDEGRPFDAVIVDLYVPVGVGGLETLERLRRIDPGARVVVASGYSSDRVMAQYREFGFEAAIDKPFDLERLAEVVRLAAGR